MFKTYSLLTISTVQFRCFVIEVRLERIDLFLHYLMHLFSSIVTGCSLAACRLILSIRSLAARLKYDPDAIFNHLELARIYGNGVGKVRKHGQYGSLIVIEVNNGEIELEDMVPSDKAPSEYTVTDVAESVGHAVSNEGHNTKRDSETLGPWAAQGQWRIHGQHH